jgi:hypothetical protein
MAVSAVSRTIICEPLIHPWLDQIASLRFLSAVMSPVALYGVRRGDPRSGRAATAPGLAATNADPAGKLSRRVGTRRMDNITLLGVRVETGFRLAGRRRVAGFADVFNLLNANPEQNTNWSSGPFFLRPLSIVPPRLAGTGVKLEWW